MATHSDNSRVPDFITLTDPRPESCHQRTKLAEHAVPNDRSQRGTPAGLPPKIKPQTVETTSYTTQIARRSARTGLNPKSLKSVQMSNAWYWATSGPILTLGSQA